MSPRHAYAVVRAHGESGITARLEPATIDGLVYASSMVVLYAARHRVPVPSLARWLLGLGIAATLTANMAQGWSHGPVGAVVAAWPAVSVVGSYELLVWLIRTSGAAEHRPPAGHLCEAPACRAAARSATTAATGAEFPRRGERDTPDQARRPAAQVAGPPAIPASGQRDQAVPDADAVNDAAVAAYRLSAQAGNPLSERKLAQMFGRTSCRWARAQSPKRGEYRLQGSPGIRLPSAPMRARSRVSAPSPASGAGWCSSSTSKGPYLPASSAQICPADSVTEAAEPVWVTTAGLTTGRQPHPEMSNTLPSRADRVPPKRFVGDQVTERRQGIRRGWRQDPSSFPQVSGRKRV